MKKFFKFIKYGVIGFVVLLGGCGILTMLLTDDIQTNTSTESKETATTEETKEVKEVATKDAPKEEPVKQTKIGEVLKVGDVEFKVNGKSEATNVGGQYGTNAKGKYLILDVSVTNKGNDALYVDSNFFKLKANDKAYSSDSSAGIYANSETDFFLSQVNPDISIEGKVVFDIPAELLEEELTLNVQTGFFGTEQGQIVLK